MTDDMIAGPTSSIASHCAAKFGSGASPASRATSGPQLPPARRSDAQALIASGCISSAPQPPKPPALATAIASEAGQAPAIGAIKMGIRILKVSQNALARATAGWSFMIPSLHGTLGMSEPPATVYCARPG